MKILVLNCVSSSLKYQLIDMSNEEALCVGLVERIGIEGSILKQEKDGVEGKLVVEQPMKNHQDAIKLVLDALVDSTYGGVKEMSEIEAVGHRVVHGGEKFASSVVINDEVKAAIEECVELAPLHNPANIMGIEACEAILPGVPMVAVFDTAFHQTMPKASYLYGLPHELYTKYGVRRYGFHGTSHKYVSQRAAEMLGKNIEDTKIVTCHLGNGASIAAINGGKCVDTSMGFTPLAGVMMGTRSGDVDPSVLPFVMRKEGLNIEEMLNVLNKQSGMLGVSGISSDSRDIEDAYKAGNEAAIRTSNLYASIVAKYIGTYFVELGGCDAIAFTAGLGENAAYLRSLICERIKEALGVELDETKNNTRSGDDRVISTENSKVKVMIIPTNEEVMIARDTVRLLGL